MLFGSRRLAIHLNNFHVFIQSANNSSRFNHILKYDLLDKDSLSGTACATAYKLKKKLCDWPDYLLERPSLNRRHVILTCAARGLYWLVRGEVASDLGYRSRLMSL